MGLKRYFVEHPASVGETYPEHARVALGVSAQLAAASLAAAVHAVVPAVFVTTASDRIKRLHELVTGGRSASTPDGNGQNFDSENGRRAVASS